MRVGDTITFKFSHWEPREGLIIKKDSSKLPYLVWFGEETLTEEHFEELKIASYVHYRDEPVLWIAEREIIS